VIEKYQRTPNTTCTICGKDIYKRPIQIKKNSGKVFCSMSCFGFSCRRENPCVVCGKMILGGLHKKTCSRSCSNINRTGIKYHIGSPRDNVKSQRALKVKLIKIRGEKCERCGYSKVEILQVHHKDRNRSNNDLKNLELICPNCHYEEHHLEKNYL
jgi:predicted nucleic acid-binding Zn ribbon protein